MFSVDLLMGTPGGGPGLSASGRPSVTLVVLGTGGILPPAGFKAAGTWGGSTSSNSSSVWFHSSSLRSESSSCASFGGSVFTGVLKLKAGDLLGFGGFIALSGVEGSTGGYSSEGVVGYGGFALESGAGTRPSCSSGFRSTMLGNVGLEDGDADQYSAWERLM